MSYTYTTGCRVIEVVFCSFTFDSQLSRRRLNLQQLALIMSLRVELISPYSNRLKFAFSLQSYHFPVPGIFEDAPAIVNYGSKHEFSEPLISAPEPVIGSHADILYIWSHESLGSIRPPDHDSTLPTRRGGRTGASVSMANL